jgi:hypothetical protein
MRIGIVGGVERNEPAYREIAELRGHTLAFHGGHLAGRGSASLTELVYRVELVIVVTDVNSHGAVQLARKLARKTGVALILQRRCSTTRFAALLSALSPTERASASAPSSASSTFT